MNYQPYLKETLLKLSELLDVQSHHIMQLEARIQELEIRRGDDFLERCYRSS